VTLSIPAPGLSVPSGIDVRMPSSPGMSHDDQVFQRLLRERIIFLGSVVDDPIANTLCAQLLLLAAEDSSRDIFLYINSPGGSVTAGMAIYDTMQYVQCDVATVGLGLAASMGQFLLCAGAAGKRYATPHARVMMHQPSGGLGGTASDIRIQAEQMVHTKRTLQERIAFHTGQTYEQIERDSDRDRWFTAEQAKEYGFVDHVVSGAGQVSSAGAVS
jgi:ATP-dependent Clp protease, protease subunit